MVKQVKADTAQGKKEQDQKEPVNKYNKNIPREEPVLHLLKNIKYTVSLSNGNINLPVPKAKI
jgi:hypothetical protein